MKSLEFYQNDLKQKCRIDENGCWIFKDLASPKTYPQYKRIINGIKFSLAHRASYYVFKGDIPKNAIVSHKCSEDHEKDNLKCINPEHLYCIDNLDYKRNIFSGANGSGSKIWTIISPTKESFKTDDLGKFCKDHEINYVSLVTNKKWFGWKCSSKEKK